MRAALWAKQARVAHCASSDRSLLSIIPLLRPRRSLRRGSEAGYHITIAWRTAMLQCLLTAEQPLMHNWMVVLRGVPAPAENAGVLTPAGRFSRRRAHATR